MAEDTTIKQYISTVVGGVLFSLFAIVITAVMEEFFKVKSYAIDSDMVFISIPLGSTLFLFLYLYPQSKSKKIIGNLFVGFIFGLISLAFGDYVLFNPQSPFIGIFFTKFVAGIALVLYAAFGIPFAVLIGYKLNFFKQ